MYKFEVTTSVKIILTAIVILSDVTFGSTIPHFKAEEVIKYRNYYGEDGKSLLLNANSVLYCANRCARLNWCVSFFYSETRGRCSLRTVSEYNTLGYHGNVRFYRASRVCESGFVYDSSTMSCSLK